MISVTKARIVSVHSKTYSNECQGDTIYYTSKDSKIGVRTVHADKNCRHLDNVNKLRMLPSTMVASYEKSCTECTVNNPSYKEGGL